MVKIVNIKLPSPIMINELGHSVVTWKFVNLVNSNDIHGLTLKVDILDNAQHTIAIDKVDVNNFPLAQIPINVPYQFPSEYLVEGDNFIKFHIVELPLAKVLGYRLKFRALLSYNVVIPDNEDINKATSESEKERLKKKKEELEKEINNSLDTNKKLEEEDEKKKKNKQFWDNINKILLVVGIFGFIAFLILFSIGKIIRG